MNNREYYFKLAHDDPHALAEWLEAEHDNDGLAHENDVSADAVDINDINATQDSREKLEADVLKKHNYMGPKPYSLVTTYDDVIGWLDRQAAITHNIDAWNIERLEKRIVELQAQLKAAQDVNERQDLEYIEHKKQIAELTAERDELRAILDAVSDVCKHGMDDISQIMEERYTEVRDD